MDERRFSEKLLRLRKEASLSQLEAAKELGISRQTISKWETGKSCPDAMYIKKISELYKVSVDELLDITLQHANLEEAAKKKDGIMRLKIWLPLGIIDFLFCFILVYRSGPMLFWVIYFNIILIAIFLLVRLVSFFKNK